MKTILALAVLVLAVVYCSATEVKPCKGAREISDLSSKVKIGNCKRPPCRLRKNRSVDFIMKFKPEEPITQLKNSVTALIVGIPFPFVGVDGEDACKNIYSADGEKQVGCPLEAGKEYLYKNKIDVLQIYPEIKVMVHWGLTAPKGDVICIEVPARITK